MGENLKVIVCTSAKATWALGVFAKLWDRYGCGDVHVACENLASVKALKLPQNYHAKQVGESWTKEQWSNGLVKYLHSIPDQYVLILLEDYWLTRAVDWSGIQTHLLGLMKSTPNLIRVDLSSDRLYTHGPKYPAHDPDWGVAGYYDLISRPDSQYQLSLQPGLWNKNLLLDVLRPDWSPWDVEIAGSGVINARPDLLVLGTRQNPIKFVNGLNNDANTVNIRGIEHPEDILPLIPADKELER